MVGTFAIHKHNKCDKTSNQVLSQFYRPKNCFFNKLGQKARSL